MSGEELLHLAGQRVEIARPQREVVARHLEPSGSADPLCEVPTSLDGVQSVARSMHHERRNGDPGEQRAHVNGARHLTQEQDRSRARPETAQRCVPLSEGLVVCERGRDRLDEVRGSPSLFHPPPELLPLLGRPPDGIVLVPASLGVGPEQDQPIDAIGVKGGGGDARGPGVGVPEQGGPFGFRRVEHGQQIRDSLVHGRDLGQSIR